MTKYLISFPGSAMDISDEDMAVVGESAHAVIRLAENATSDGHDALSAGSSGFGWHLSRGAGLDLPRPGGLSCGAQKRCRDDFTSVREVTKPQTYQVCRQEFDRILLERAREVGVTIQEGCNVTACELTPDAAILDVTSRGEAVTRRVQVRAIVDATGRGGLIARKFDLRTYEPRLANIAVFSHYTNVPRLEGPRPDDIRLIARSDAGWFWLIPISEELMSVGVVLPRDLYTRLAKGSPEETLQHTISDTPILAELMRNARREWPVRVEKDFSYSASTFAGHRWILAGDAGSFLDPVFSTGVSIAMDSGIEAAAELDRALARNDFSAPSFAAFSRRQRKRFERFRRFVVGFYTPPSVIA